MAADTRKQTFIVATLLCLICSVLVSTAAVVLRPRQQENKRLDIQQNILRVAGIFAPDDDVSATDIEREFRQVETALIVLGSDRGGGTEVSEQDAEYEQIDLKNFDPRKEVAQGRVAAIPPGELPQIANRAMFSHVYKIRNADGALDQIVLPVYGKGLWSTLYGFIALESDGVTIRGITFYEHGETPGLGGEVDNPKWKASWNGKKAFGEIDGRSITIKVLKGQVNPDSATAPYEVDGLSGATITSNGVTALVQYWLGPHGFGKYLENLRAENGTETSDG